MTTMRSNRGIAARAWSQHWKILAVLLVLAGVAYVAQPVILGPKILAERVVRREVVRTVVASGRVETPYRVEIGSQITGVVVRIPVEQGQKVRRDQLLIQLDDEEAQAAVEQADAAVSQAEARLRQTVEVALPVAEENLHQATATRVNARQQFERVDRLRAGGHATQAQWEDARKALDIAQAQERAAQLQVDSNRPGGTDYQLIQTALRQARASLLMARVRLDYTNIEAPADGTLIARNVERGDVVQPGKALMVLSPAGETQIVVQIDEKNLGLIKLGQPALASADAYPDQRFRADLVYINPSVDPQRASVEVKLSVPNPPDYIRQDMTVSVDVEFARKPQVLVLPTTAIHDMASGHPWVMKVVKGRARRQAVKIGLDGEGRAEIMDGVDASDLVLPATVSLADGRRVRATGS